MVRKLLNFDDWIDYFKYWQDSIGLPAGALRSFEFDAKFGDPEVPHIEFGHYRGQRKWPTVMHIPDQRIRDALLNLIVYQGDTEFASVVPAVPALRRRGQARSREAARAPRR